LNSIKKVTVSPTKKVLTEAQKLL